MLQIKVACGRSYTAAVATFKNYVTPGNNIKGGMLKYSTSNTKWHIPSLLTKTNHIMKIERNKMCYAFLNEYNCCKAITKTSPFQMEYFRSKSTLLSQFIGRMCPTLILIKQSKNYAGRSSIHLRNTCSPKIRGP